jgi:hypothetical protein
MDDNLVNRIEKFLSKTEFEGLLGKPASDKEIHNAEKTLNVKFDNNYIHFIKKFGGSCAGISIYAFSNGSLLGKETVVELTEMFRESLGDAIPNELIDAYVISDDGAGNPVLINKQGNVLIYFHDSLEIDFLHESLEEMLLKYFPKNGGYYV